MPPSFNNAPQTPDSAESAHAVLPLRSPLARLIARAEHADPSLRLHSRNVARLSLEPWERRAIQRHPAAGQRLLEPYADSPELLAIVRSHHERWDGDGYPDGLEADQIPLGARIVAVADAFTAMVEPRPYREPLSCRLARAELLEQAGKQLDPLCARAGFSVTGALLPAANG